MHGKDDLIQPHGGYRRLRSFQTAQIVYDATVVFCARFVDKRSRTHDQMVQAARSGVQNIAEGSMASGTSKKMELKLTGVARASLEELLLDYEDFLRQRGLRIWDKESAEALSVRRKYRSDRSDKSDTSDIYGIRTASAEVAANTVICLINPGEFSARQAAEEAGAVVSCRGWIHRAALPQAARATREYMIVFSESNLEQAFLSWLAELGCAIQHGHECAFAQLPVETITLSSASGKAK